MNSSRIVIDRRRGSAHPHWPELIYPLDYGFLEGTVSADGDCIDVWIGSSPSREVVGIVCTADVGKRDAELKVLFSCSTGEIEVVKHFLNQTLGLPWVILERY